MLTVKTKKDLLNVFAKKKTLFLKTVNASTKIHVWESNVEKDNAEETTKEMVDLSEMKKMLFPIFKKVF